MAESDHFIKRIPEKVKEEKCEDKETKLLGKFVWSDDLEEDDTTDKPAVLYQDNDLESCCTKIAQSILSGVTIDNFRGVESDHMYFEIPLEADHLVLIERFNSCWSLDSRLEMLDNLRAKLDSVVETDLYRSDLNRRIQGIIPDARKSCLSDQVYLNDDSIMMEEEGSPFSVEVSLRFERKAEVS